MSDHPSAKRTTARGTRPGGQDGEPSGTETLAMGWATVAEQGLPQHEDSLMLGDGDAHFLASLRGDTSPEGIERNSR
ncbi:MAG TPA: hypothetical protein VK104_00715, partial [Burkholderiaceae bacterium]|nr:hypothetical protein [Burkholderiaceae bacterium]